MNKHIHDCASAHTPLAFERRSKLLTLLDAILAPLKKRKHGEHGAVTPSSARIVMTPDGSPIRSVITGRRVIVTGFYSSRKAGRALPFESMNEAAMLKHCEVDTRVLDYRSQPFRFEFVLDGAPRTYIADCVRLLDDETIEVVEVKGARNRLGDADYLQKLDRVRHICCELGWRFSIMTRKRLFEPPATYANIDLIQSRRLVVINLPRAYEVLDHLDRERGSSSLGAISRLLGPGPLGSAMAQAMMVRRWINIDIASPLTDQSMVTLVPAAQPISLGAMS